MFAEVGEELADAAGDGVVAFDLAKRRMPICKEA